LKTHNNGAEMMRRAAIYAANAGIRICCPVHDAFLIEAPLADIEHEAFRMNACMSRASRDVLDGFELKTDVKFIRYLDRFGNVSDPLWKMAHQYATQPLPKQVVLP
jgi:hypothetical protein